MRTLSLIPMIALGGMVLVSPLANAQEKEKPAAKPAEAGQRPPGGPGANREAIRDRMAKMESELKLTDEQKEKMRVLREDQGKKMREIMQDSSLSQEQKREKLQSFRTESDKKMKEILTPEQFETWQKTRPAGGRGPGGPPPGDGKAPAAPKEAPKDAAKEAAK